MNGNNYLPDTNILLYQRSRIIYTKNETKILLIDGEKLSQYMIDYILGVSVQNNYGIKKNDTDYFEEELILNQLKFTICSTDLKASIELN